LIFVLFFSSIAISAKELAIFDNHLNAYAAYDPLTIIANITLGKNPYSIAVNEATNRIYVGVDGGLMVINGETDQVIAEIPLGDDVVALAVNPITNRIYAGIYGKNITVIDGATNLKVGEIPEGLYNNYELAVNPNTNLVYVGEWTVWVGEADGVLVYNGENFEQIASVALGVSSHIERVGVTVNPNSNRIYATWSGNSSLYMIDGNTHTITKDRGDVLFSVFLQRDGGG
jgi:DNA-binding beta-propeller fold protein YncE